MSSARDNLLFFLIFLEDYEGIARQALVQRSWLQKVREKLAKAKMKSPLFDTRQWTRAMEAAVRMAWDIYRMHLPPCHVVVYAGVGRRGRD